MDLRFLLAGCIPSVFGSAFIFLSCEKIEFASSPSVFGVVALFVSAISLIIGSIVQSLMAKNADGKIIHKQSIPRRFILPLLFGGVLLVGVTLACAVFDGNGWDSPNQWKSLPPYFAQAWWFLLLSTFRAWLAPTVVAASIGYTLISSMASGEIILKSALGGVLANIFEGTPQWIPGAYEITSLIYLVLASILPFIQGDFEID